MERWVRGQRRARHASTPQPLSLRQPKPHASHARHPTHRATHRTCETTTQVKREEAAVCSGVGHETEGDARRCAGSPEARKQRRRVLSWVAKHARHESHAHAQQACACVPAPAAGRGAHNEGRCARCGSVAFSAPAAGAANGRGREARAHARSRTRVWARAERMEMPAARAVGDRVMCDGAQAAAGSPTLCRRRQKIAVTRLRPPTSAREKMPLDGPVGPARLTVACLDCARFDARDFPAAWLAAVASSAPYAMVLGLAAVRWFPHSFSRVARGRDLRPLLHLVSSHPPSPQHAHGPNLPLHNIPGHVRHLSLIHI